MAEVVILFCGISARYAFHAPLIWSDELASILFLWLAMFGAALAVLRLGHMRLSYLADRVSPRRCAACPRSSQSPPPLIFAVMVMQGALDYADDQSFVETPCPGLVRPGPRRRHARRPGPDQPPPRLLQLATLRLRGTLSVPASSSSAGLPACSGSARPALHAIGNWNLVAFFVVLLGAGVLSGLPIAFGFALATVAYLLCTTSTPLADRGRPHGRGDERVDPARHAHCSCCWAS